MGGGIQQTNFQSEAQALKMCFSENYLKLKCYSYANCPNIGYIYQYQPRVVMRQCAIKSQVYIVFSLRTAVGLYWRLA